MGLSEQAKDAAREHVTQKAARDILTSIEEWTGNRVLTAKRRWIFELVQNAVDTAKARQTPSVKIEIHTDNSSLVFRHNGGYFTLEEIPALIYGGSTKPFAPESEYIGRFGTGLLVSHIISRNVRIEGTVRDNEGQLYHFELDINREGVSPDEIAQEINRCFLQLDDAVVQPAKKEYWTEFVYARCDEPGADAIQTGIDELKSTLPFLLAFNDIQEIVVNEERFVKQSSVNQSFARVDVGEHSVYVAKADDAGVQVGVLVQNGKIVSLAGRPKIFVGMPLTETADYLSIPFAVNSVAFEPTKERNALSAQYDNKNRKLVELSFALYLTLIRALVESESLETWANLVDFELIPAEHTAQNALWQDFNRYLSQAFSSILADIPLVETLAGKQTLNDTIFVIDQLDGYEIGEAAFGTFYDLVSEIDQKIPIRDQVDEWKATARRLQSRFPDSDLTLYGISDLKDELEEFVKKGNAFPTLDKFRSEFDLTDARQFLKRFFNLVDTLYQIQKLSIEFIQFLLVSQQESIGPLKRQWTQSHVSFELLLEDPEHPLPDELKEIAEGIGRPIKSELVDNDFAQFHIVRDYVRHFIDVKQVLNNLLKEDYYRPPEVIDDWESNEVNGWLDLFRWCAINDELTTGFYIVTKDSKTQELGDLAKEAFLVPFEWMGTASRFEELYTESRIMHPRYFDVEDRQRMGFLAALGNYDAFVTNLPVSRHRAQLDHNKLKSILCDSNTELSKVMHTIEADTGTISDLPFWNEVIGKIAHDQELGKLFFEFLIEFMIGKDPRWQEQTRVTCSCRNEYHTIIPSRWLASAKTDGWVALTAVEDGEEKIVQREATKESLENLLGADSLESVIQTNPDAMSKFLPHFGFDDLDLKIKQQASKTGKTEEMVRSETSQLVSLVGVLESPDIIELVEQPDILREAIQEARKNRAERAAKEDNRKIGKNVELIVKQILQGCELDVEPIHRGGDLEIWPEEGLGWDSGQLEICPYTLEIKFTSGARVHLSTIQSETARERAEHYVVLVVKSVNGLRERLIADLEDTIPEDLVDAVKATSHVVENLHTKLGQLPDSYEIEPDLLGYWVKSTLWGNKEAILEWVGKVFGANATAAQTE